MIGGDILQREQLHRHRVCDRQRIEHADEFFERGDVVRRRTDNQRVHAEVGNDAHRFGEIEGEIGFVDAVAADGQTTHLFLHGSCQRRVGLLIGRRQYLS